MIYLLFMTIAGFYLLFTPLWFRNKKPFWPWMTLGLAGLNLLLSLSFKYLTDNLQYRFSESQIDALSSAEKTFGGIFLGMVFTLCLCGFIPLKRKNKNPNQEFEPTSLDAD